MKGSTGLIINACDGIQTSRTPIFDLLLNDAVIEHFSGLCLDGSDDYKASMEAVKNALDGTRVIMTPSEEKTWIDQFGNTRKSARWTSWIQKHAFDDTESWKAWIKSNIDQIESMQKPSDSDRKAAGDSQRAFIQSLEDTLYIFCTPSSAINTALFGYCGLEIFSYLWADDKDLILRWMRALERATYDFIDVQAHQDNCPLAMIYSDVAYKQRLMFSKDMMHELGFFDDIEQICTRCHAKGLKVIFHSDGYVMDILPDLIAAGIDGLNPIEKAAGMDIYEIRRMYPELILVGGVDVTHLLPFGTPDEVRRETRRIINETGSEGRLLIGSSTEMDNTVPLENYLAFHDEVMKGR